MRKTSEEKAEDQTGSMQSIQLGYLSSSIHQPFLTITLSRFELSTFVIAFRSWHGESPAGALAALQCQVIESSSLQRIPRFAFR
jgi:hypothetical protein